jgi:hypothetical protein
MVALNAGLGASTPAEHAMVLRHALHRLPNVQCLIYGTFDDQLQTQAPGGFRDLVGNRALSYQFPEEAARFYAPDSTFERWRLRAVGALPMLRERSVLWTKVEQARRWLGDLGGPPQATNRFGRVADFSALQASSVADFKSRARRATRSSLTPAVREILSLARSAGARLFIVEMPLPSAHRASFYSTAEWQSLRLRNIELVGEAGASYISAADWMPDSAFEDATHLSPEGATSFSRRLAVEIAASERLRSSVADLH